MYKYDKNFTRLKVNKDLTIIRNFDEDNTFDVYERIKGEMHQFVNVGETFLIRFYDIVLN